MAPLVFGAMSPFGIIVYCNILIIHATSKMMQEMDTKYRRERSKWMFLLVWFAFVATPVPYRLHDLIGFSPIELYHDPSYGIYGMRPSSICISSGMELCVEFIPVVGILVMCKGA
jgi:hypothetical protein